MRLDFLLALILGGAVLIAYSLIERHINQRACPQCRFRVSVDTPDEQCPRCGAALVGK